MKGRSADATWEMLALKFIINYSPLEYTAASRVLGDRNQELGATFWREREGWETKVGCLASIF